MTSPDAPPAPVALILSGGLALGAFQAGFFEALDDPSLDIKAVAGSSMGAYNGAIIAGNPPEKRADMLDRFWRRLEIDPNHFISTSLPGASEDGFWYRFQGITSTVMSRLGGVPGLLRPSSLSFVKSGEGPSLYDHTPAVATLEEFVDFDLLNNGPVRVCICTTDMEVGAQVLFDTKAGDRITPLHIMASGALVPNLPPVRIGQRLLADGGLCANAPLEPFLSSERREDIPRWILLTDLFPLEGMPPSSLAAASERANDLKYATQTALRLQGLLRERALEVLTLQGADREGTDLIAVDYHETGEPSRMEKIFDFSRPSLSRRRHAGREAGVAAFQCLTNLRSSASPAGLRLHDLRGSRQPSKSTIPATKEIHVPDRDQEAAEIRGMPPLPGTGEVKGSGAGAGGSGNPEDYDVDAPGGSGAGASGQSSPQPVEGDDDVVPPTEDSPKG